MPVLHTVYLSPFVPASNHRIVLRQSGSSNTTNDGDDDSSLNSGEIAGIVVSIGTIYLIYMGIATAIYGYLFLEWGIGLKDWRGTLLVAITLFPIYVLIATLLFPFVLCMLGILSVGCAYLKQN